jgi:hypothetical protein
MPSSHSAGTTPRTSYALMIDDRSGNAAHPRPRGFVQPGARPAPPTLTAAGLRDLMALLRGSVASVRAAGSSAVLDQVRSGSTRR